jgi:hypothetical protein
MGPAIPVNLASWLMSSLKDPTGLSAADLTRIVIGVFFDVYNHMGRGFLESVYEGSLESALGAAGVKVQRPYPVPCSSEEEGRVFSGGSTH